MLTRRSFFLTLPAAAMIGNAAGKESLVYVGSYTRGGSKGIYAYRFDHATGKLTEAGLAAEVPNPSFLAIHPNRRYLYAVNEQGGEGAVTAFEIDRASGKLAALNSGQTGGASPCHLVVDRTMQNLLVVNYGKNASTAVFRLAKDGRLGERTSLVVHSGSGPNEKRQTAPHAHSVNLSKSQRYAIVADLGTDEFLVYKFDASKGTVAPHGAAKVKPGSGPRHFSFSPDFRHGYGLNEMGSLVSVFRWDESAGTLTHRQDITTLPSDFRGTNNCAEILVHPNGRFVYASNRGHNSLAIYSADRAEGTLTSLGQVSTQGQIPRNFRIDPSGNWLIAANQDSGNIVVFRLDKSSGKLTPAGVEVKTPFPVCIKFL